MSQRHSQNNRPRNSAIPLEERGWSWVEHSRKPMNKELDILKEVVDGLSGIVGDKCRWCKTVTKIKKWR